MKDKLLIICGPTASGKSELAVFAAQKFNGEVISADSMQIYKNMNIGTAKVTIPEMAGIPHHLIDVIEPNQSFSVAEYKENAEKILKDLSSRNKNAIIAGGTGLYINSLIYDYSYGNSSANTEIREKYKLLAEEKGNDYIYNILKKLNPERAAQLHPNDRFRIVRALELIESDTPIIQDSQSLIRDYKAIAINQERELLYDKINKRVDKMFELGLLNEVADLIKNGLSFDNQSMKAIGYKEFKAYFDKTATIEEVKDKIKQNSRNYAKRQITWFKKLPNIVWCESKEDAIREIEEFYEN